MAETLTVEQATRELAEDHQRLHALIDRVGREQDLSATAEALADLHAALTRHFNQEEKPGGLYDALARPGSASTSPSSWTTTSASPASCATFASRPGRPRARPPTRCAPGSRASSRRSPTTSAASTRW
jgi:hypothetical protein